MFVFTSDIIFFSNIVHSNTPQEVPHRGSQRSNVLGHNGPSRSERYIPETSEQRQHQPPAAPLPQYQGQDGGKLPVPSYRQEGIQLKLR